MAEKKLKPLGDEEVMTLVNQKVKECTGWYDSKLSRERQRVIDYYNSSLPKRQHAGSASYISTDVYDAIESMKCQLLETFAANPDNLVSFPAQGADDVIPARVATEYCSYVVFRENEGYDVFSSVIHDGLSARVGVAKVFWEKIEDKIEEKFDGIGYQDVQGLAAQEDIADLNADAEEKPADPQNPMFSGTLQRTIDRSKVTINAIPPEEFLIEPRAKNIPKAGCVSHRTLKTKAELIDMGYDAVKVEGLHYDDSKGLDLSPEVLARNAQVETSSAVDNPIQPELEKVMFYESYVRMDMRDGKGALLYKICHADTVLLAKDEVDRAPFMVFVPLPIPHLFYGNNFGARVAPTQNARTVLTRAILDHTSITTNPRWGVVKGGLLNPKEMLDNRLGGIVNMTRPDAVKALEQQNLNPFVFQTLEMLKTNKEETTGISALSQGLNKDAISTQNSGALVDNLVTLSQGRQKIIARNFAYGFLVPLYLEVYRLVLENEKKEKIIEIAGAPASISTEEWVDRRICKVALHLGYGERDRETAKYANTYQMLAKDPSLGTMFGGPQRYKLITDGLKSAGFENFADYIADPAKTPAAPPDPLKMKELEIKDKEASAQLITAQSLALKNEKLAEVAAMKEQLAELQMHVKAIMTTKDSDRKDADVQNRIDISQREMTLLEAQPISKEQGIVSPRSS